MISEHKLASAYSSFWRVTLPFADKFTRWMNGNTQWFADPFEISARPERVALVSEMSFRLLRAAIITRSLEFDQQTLVEEGQAAWSYIARFEPSGDFFRPVEAEIHDAVGLCGNLLRFFRRFDPAELIHRPNFGGCGLVDDCTGDILADSTLYEIKNVDRPFRIVDIRQLLIYCALNSAKKVHEIGAVGLINGRSGQFYRVGLDVVVPRLTGASPTELFGDIIDFVSSDKGSH